MSVADRSLKRYACRDPPVKQLILALDEEEHFVIQDLDETHLLVSADSVEKIRNQLEDEVDTLPSAPTQSELADHLSPAREEYIRSGHLGRQDRKYVCCCNTAAAHSSTNRFYATSTVLSFFAIAFVLPS